MNALSITIFLHSSKVIILGIVQSVRLIGKAKFRLVTSPLSFSRYQKAKFFVFRVLTRLANAQVEDINHGDLAIM